MLKFEIVKSGATCCVSDNGSVSISYNEMPYVTFYDVDTHDARKTQELGTIRIRRVRDNKFDIQDSYLPNKEIAMKCLSMLPYICRILSRNLDSEAYKGATVSVKFHGWLPCDCVEIAQSANGVVIGERAISWEN